MGLIERLSYGITLVNILPGGTILLINYMDNNGLTLCCVSIKDRNEYFTNQRKLEEQLIAPIPKYTDQFLLFAGIPALTRE